MPRVKRCTVHLQVQVFPGIWRPDRLIGTGQSNQANFKEDACPRCIQTARALLQSQCPALYTTGRCFRAVDFISD